MKIPVILASLALCAISALAAERPNFIFFITDDISAEDLGCYGNSFAQTPHLDQMAADGMRFTQAYLTISSCSPSRCSTITGRYPHNTGAPELHTSLPTDQPTFVQALKEAGYHTVISGKNHMGKANELGFTVESKGKGPSKSEDWVGLLESRPKDQPFFCWFGSADAHRGWQINDEAPVYDPAKVPVPPYLADGPKTRQDLADYFHEVSRTDYYMGKLRAELERQGIADNTYVIYCADNGRPLPRAKTRLYDSGIKTPLLIAGPGVDKAVSDSIVSSIDFSATILDLADVEKLPTIQGVSFANVLADPKAKTRDYAFAEHNWHVFQAHERMVRFGDWLYIRNAFPELQNLCMEADPTYPAGEELWEFEAAGKLNPEQRDIFLKPRPAEELYRVSKDPHQIANLAANPENSPVLEEARALLEQWTEATGDSIPDDITNDRQDAYGKKNPDHKRGTLPGEDRGAAKINAKGPVLAK